MCSTLEQSLNIMSARTSSGFLKNQPICGIKIPSSLTKSLNNLVI